jgi:putative ABC transport system permease protein
MRFTNLIQIAFRSLGKNKMRSFLTMLGIIIGVASVIAMLAIGQGSRESIQKQISNLGTNIMIILPFSSNQGGVRMEAGTSQKLTLDDANAIAKKCPSVKYVSAMVRTSAQFIAGSQNWRTTMYGVSTDYLSIRNVNLVSGNNFTSSDDRAAAKVCIIGQTVATYLFGEDVDPVGLSMRANNIPYKIIGLLEKKGQNSFGQDQDDVVLGPFSTVQKRMIANNFVSQILVSAVDEKLMDQASQEISDLLLERHKSTEPDFTIRTQSELGSAADATSKVMTILLASIAGISLLVGGIGIMNIMLVSVTERTREIGIRLAVGARGNDVLMQFLIEAVLLSFIGGALGVIFGYAVSIIVSDTMGWPVAIMPDAVLLAFVFSTAIGIFFGWYPARKAARLNPIDALRYE